MFCVLGTKLPPDLKQLYFHRNVVNAIPLVILWTAPLTYPGDGGVRIAILQKLSEFTDINPLYFGIWCPRWDSNP